MRRFRRFRRFRGFRGTKQRPTWRKLFDLTDNSQDNGPFLELGAFTQTSAAGGVHSISKNTSANSYVILGAGAQSVDSTVIQLVQQIDVDFFEGECSLLRVMGNIKLHHCSVVTEEGSNINKLIEVRAWIYKTWEQEVDQKIGLVHPFDGNAFDSRIVWSTRWFTTPQTTPIANLKLAPATVGYGEQRVGSPGTAEARGSFTNPTLNERRISFKQPIKFKGQERLAMVIAAGPIDMSQATSIDNGIAFLFSGWARGLYKH